MAVFNPQEPSQDPNFTRDSHGISGGFGVDTSTGIGLETAAKGITEGVGIIDTGVKDYLKDTVRNTVEKERADYTSYLETVKTMQQANKIPGAGDGESIMDANASADIPDGLQAGMDRAKSLAAAGNTGNKINDTLYSARLASEASGLRGQWSGYKDYIDEQFSKYSGMDPANAYYKNLMQDINTLAAKGNADKNKVDNVILEAVKAGDVDNADKIWSMHKAGKMSDDDAIHEIYKARAAKAAATAAEAQRTARQGDRADTAAVATRDFSQEFSDKVNRDMGLIQVGSGTKSLKDAVNWLTQMSQNPDQADPKQVQAVVTALNAKRDELYQSGMARASERDKTGQSYITRMGGVDKVKGEIEGNLAGLDQYIKSVNNQQWGIGTYVQRRMAAQGDQDQQALLEHPTLGPPMRKVATLQKIAPNYADVFIKSGLVGNVPESLNTYFNEQRIDAATQPDFLSSGKVNTMKQTIDNIDNKVAKIQNADGTQKYSPQDIAKLKTEAFNIPKTIADPQAPIELKANIARHAYDPENIGILQGIKLDYYDPYTKRQIPGKYSAFQRMTSPDIIDNLEKVRKAVPDGPQIWDNAKNWTRTEFQKLMREDLANLNTTNITNPYAAASGSYDPLKETSKLHIGWNTGENGQPPRMSLLDDKGNPFDSRNAPGSLGAAARNVDQTITRVNSAMYNMHQFYKKDNQDTNMPILQDMLSTWTPNEKTTGLPAKVMEAIIQANKTKLQKMEDTFHPGAKE